MASEARGGLQRAPVRFARLSPAQTHCFSAPSSPDSPPVERIAQRGAQREQLLEPGCAGGDGRRRPPTVAEAGSGKQRRRPACCPHTSPTSQPPRGFRRQHPAFVPLALPLPQSALPGMWDKRGTSSSSTPWPRR